VNFDEFGFAPVILPDNFSEICTSELPLKDATEEEYQTYLNKEIEKFKFGEPQMSFHDTHAIAYLDGRKPDISFVVGREKLSVFSVVVVGEIKNRATKSKISQTDSFGEIITFIHRAMKFGRGRSFCYGFITDCETIYFLKVVFDPTVQLAADAYSYFKTPVYNLKEKGGGYLYTMLSQAVAELGWCNRFISLRGIVYNLEALLGEGLTSSVWKCENYAIKHFKSTRVTAFNQECVIYNILNNYKVSGVTRLIDKGIDFIVTTPVGVPMNVLETFHIKDILTTLKCIHGIGLVHRDLRLSNIIEVDGRAILIDWGFAAQSGVTSFSGAYRFAPDEILRAEDASLPVPYTAKHDLTMFLRVCWVFLRHKAAMLKELEKSEDIINFFSPMRKSKMWSICESCCENLDYVGLFNGLEEQFGSDIV